MSFALTGHYPEAAPVYRGLGWSAPIPLPEGQKKTPPIGTTGHTAPDPTTNNIVQWSKQYEKGNIALRLPSDVIAIDVDSYGNKPGGASLTEMISGWGSLPPTWISTARAGLGDSVSGQRFYRIPSDIRLKDKPAPGIDIVQRTHRYSVVAPSWNPDCDSWYLWYGPDGKECGPPRPDQLPDLPEAWVQGLRVENRQHVGQGDGVVDLAQANGYIDITLAYIEKAKELKNCHDTAKKLGIQLAANNCPVADAVRIYAGLYFQDTQHLTDRVDYTLSEVQRTIGWAFGREWEPLPQFSVEPWMQEFANSVGEAPEVDERTFKEVLKLRANREANRILDAEEAEAARGVRVRRTAREFALLPPPEVVMDKVLASELNLLGGPSGAGKSLIARDWSLALAAGVPWNGYEVPRARKVVWIASEGTHDFRERWASHPLWERGADNIEVIDNPINLVGDSEWLMEEYKGEDVGLVVFDVIYGMGMSDDNGMKDVLPVINLLKHISAVMECATLAIGHTGHVEERRFRGSSSWRQLSAVEWHLADGRLSCEKSKIADKNRLNWTAEITYPHVHLSEGLNLAKDAKRYQLVMDDVAQYPTDSNRTRAERLAPVMGISVERCRSLVNGYMKSL